VKLSLRQKTDFYRELGQLMRSGIAFPAAIKTLLDARSGAGKRLPAALRRAVDAGSTVGEAFASLDPAVSRLEISIVDACDRSGKLDQGCDYLSEYFAKLDAARRLIIRKSLYPAFVLHFGVFVLPATKLVTGGSANEYLKQTFGLLLPLYACCALAAFVTAFVMREGARLPTMDFFLRLIPGVGKMRRAFALSRFCMTYDMQLQSGVNVMDSLTTAGAASQSALVIAAVEKMLPQIRGGAQVGPLLTSSRAFTEEMVRGIKIGEESGELDRELKRLAGLFQQEAVNRLEMFAAVFSKLIYFAVVIYIGYQIIQGYSAYLKQVDAAGNLNQ
jgi:type II secretory pathway component PulF